MWLPMSSYYRMFYLRDLLFDRTGKRQYHVLICKNLVIEITVSIYFINAAVISVKLIISKFILYP